jgi:hypothetical protein
VRLRRLDSSIAVIALLIAPANFARTTRPGSAIELRRVDKDGDGYDDGPEDTPSPETPPANPDTPPDRFSRQLGRVDRKHRRAFRAGTCAKSAAGGAR